MQAGSWAEVVSPRYAAPAAMFTIGIGLHAFNAFIASTTMPSAAFELDAVSLLSWATSAYLVASIVGGAAAAVFKARLGARAVLIAASLVFMIGTIAFASASAVGVLIAGRALQGLGEGVVMACCYALIPEIFPKTLVPRIFALESVVWVLAALGGPLVAGAISEFVSWRAAVWINLPASFVFVALVPLCVPRSGAAAVRAVALPLLQIALIALGVFALSASGVVADDINSTVLLVVGTLLLIAVAPVDQRAKVRLLPPEAFNVVHPLGAGLVLVLLLCIAEAPSVVFVAFAGQAFWGLSPTAAGFLTALVAIAWSVTAIAVAHMPRLAASAHIVPAPLILGIGLGLAALALTLSALSLAIVGQILIGVSFGFSWARLCEHIMDVAPAAERDFAAGAIPTIQSAGLSIGAAYFGAAGSALGLEAGLGPAAVAAIIAPLFAAGALFAAASTWVARRAA